MGRIENRSAVRMGERSQQSRLRVLSVCPFQDSKGSKHKDVTQKCVYLCLALTHQHGLSY